MKYTTFIGLDVHKEFITVALAYQNGEPIIYGNIPNTPEALAKLVKKLSNAQTLSFCYEAGFCGFDIYRKLTKMGVHCIVVAPSLIPSRPGDRVKTDRRDACKLARFLRSGELTAVHVPTEEEEALRELLRARREAGKDLTRKRHQVTRFLLRFGIRPLEKMTPWTQKHRKWLESIHFELIAYQLLLIDRIHAMDEAKARVERLETEIKKYIEKIPNQRLLKALQSLKGVGLITAATLIAELGDMSRFPKAEQLMAYVGMVPSEHSSGGGIHRGGITKTGNTFVRAVIIEASWQYRHIPKNGDTLKKRQQGLSNEVKAIAWKAQHRLNHKYRSMVVRGKSKQSTIVAVGRELLGFVWSIANQIQLDSNNIKAA